jgi:hypothetical protein
MLLVENKAPALRSGTHVVLVPLWIAILTGESVILTAMVCAPIRWR